MTQEHSITPPSELVQQWITEGHYQDYCNTTVYCIAQAARWGADQELEACCEWVEDNFDHCNSTDRSDWLRAARRPKPPSLKEQALAIVENLGICDRVSPKDEEILRRAIKSLPS